MLPHVKYFFIIFFLNVTVLPQTIKSVIVEGHFDFNKNDIINWSGISSGIKIYPNIEDSVKYNLAHHFADRGYIHASFEGTHFETSKDTSQNNFIINIQQGPPTYFNSIDLSGLDSAQYLAVVPYFSFLKGQVFDDIDIEEEIKQSLAYFENNGYPFAKVNVPSIYFYYDSSANNYYANVRLSFSPGLLCRLEHFEIIGNTKTASNVILRELRLTNGELYSQKVVDAIPATLNKLGFFEPVSPPQFFLNPKNEGILRITVKERQTNNFDGVIGYIPSSGQNQTGYLTGLVNISLRNLFGTGRAVSINWQQLDKYSQLLELKYLEPWIFGYPFNITGDLLQRKQDSTYVQRKFEASFEYLATETISAAITISTEQIIPSIGDSTIFTVFNSGTITTGLNFTVDTRDDPFSPTKGILFANSFSYSSKKINGPSQFITPKTQTETNLQRLTLDVSGFYQIFSKQVIALGIHGRELRGSSFEISDLFRLGGANSLRGYQEDQFLGNRIFWSNFEYRALLAKRTFGFLFFDTGYFLRNADSALGVQKTEGFRIGYGVGFNLETSLGILRVSFALAKGEPFSEAKIHFGIVNEF
jgi:outer membrane protein insertion porin family